MSIAILVPTLGRPNQLRKMMDSALATAKYPDYISFFVAMTATDHALPLYEAALTARSNVQAWTWPEYSSGYKWNKLSQLAYQNITNRLFMLGADDMQFTTPLWDAQLFDHYSALPQRAHVYHLQDSRDHDGTPHPIVTREYIDIMGYFLPPMFLHWYVDAWTVAIAKGADCFTHMTDYLLKHDKPSDHGAPDATHTGIRARGWHEVDTFTWHRLQPYLESEKARLQQALQQERAA